MIHDCISIVDKFAVKNSLRFIEESFLKILLKVNGEEGKRYDKFEKC